MMRAPRPGESGEGHRAVSDVVTANKLKSLAAGKMGYSTTEVGDLIANKVAE